MNQRKFEGGFNQTLYNRIDNFIYVQKENSSAILQFDVKKAQWSPGAMFDGMDPNFQIYIPN